MKERKKKTISAKDRKLAEQTTVGQGEGAAGTGEKLDEEQKIREAARKLKYEEEKLRETENRLKQLEIERQQEIERQLLKEQAEQRAKEEELRLKEEKLKAADQKSLSNNIIKLISNFKLRKK